MTFVYLGLTKKAKYFHHPRGRGAVENDIRILLIGFFVCVCLFSLYMFIRRARSKYFQMQDFIFFSELSFQCLTKKSENVIKWSPWRAYTSPGRAFWSGRLPLWVLWDPLRLVWYPPRDVLRGGTGAPWLFSFSRDCLSCIFSSWWTGDSGWPPTLKIHLGKLKSLCVSLLLKYNVSKLFQSEKNDHLINFPSYC